MGTDMRKTACFAAAALCVLSLVAGAQEREPPTRPQKKPNLHCQCDPNLKMKDFRPTAEKTEKWLIAQFNICRTNAMDDPSTTTTVDWGDGSDNHETAMGDWPHGSPDIFGTHTYSKAGRYTVTVTMETTCHYKGDGQCDYHCKANGHVDISVAEAKK